MGRFKRSHLLMLLVVACAGDQIVSGPRGEDLLLWRGNRMYVVSAPDIARGATRAVNLPDVHDIADVDAASNAVAISAVPSDIQGCRVLLGTPASGFRELLAIPFAVPAITV